MRYWIYAEPVSSEYSEPVWTVLSDKAILEEYWPYWKQRMTKAGHTELDTERCIEDWVTVHWAVEATPETLLRIINE